MVQMLDGQTEHPVIKIRPMSTADIPLGMSLREEASWNQTSDDWLRSKRSWPSFRTSKLPRCNEALTLLRSGTAKLSRSRPTFVVYMTARFS